VRHGARLLGHSPSFTLVAVCSLALGIGATSAIFSLVDSVLLKSLPVRDPGRLVLLDNGSWTNPIWEQVRERESQLFEAATAWAPVRFDLSRGGRTDFVEGLWVSGRFFDVLGVPAVLGRTFTTADDRRDGGASGPVAVISHAFWQRHFGGAADVVGRTITLDRVAFTIVGVTRPGFFGPSVGRSFDVAVPLGAQAVARGPESFLDQRSYWVLEIMARLTRGQTLEEATIALRAVQPQIREATVPEGWPAKMVNEYLREGLTLVPAASGPAWLRTRYQRPLLVMMAVAGIVLLIACANVANLLLARAAGRQHEFSTRLALGASRLRLGRQLLAESLLLAGLGAAVGLAFAVWGSALLVRQLSTPRDTIALEVGLDWRVIAFTAAVAIATALLFGVAPAFRAGSVEALGTLRQQGRAMGGPRRGFSGSPLVVVQVALSLVLVVPAGLFVRTFNRLASLDLGFDRDAVLVVSLDASRSQTAPADRLALYERVREAVAALPGITGAGLSEITPVSGAGWNGPVIGPELAHLSDRERMTFLNAVTPGWFATYGTTLLAGRDFDSRDRAAAPRVAIVNEAFARRFLSGGNPVGRTIRRQEGPGDTVGHAVEIVGLVEDAAYRSVRDPVPPVMYLPMAQAAADGPRAAVALSVRTTVAPSLLTNSLTAAIAEVDSDLSLTFRPLGTYVAASLVRERMLAILSGFFGTLALLLAGIGLYGMTSYAVSRRRAEIGIRMALGAEAGRVVRLVLRRVAVLVGLGVLLGAGVSLWASRFVSALLYGLEPRDPTTLIAAAFTLAAIGALAAWLPARRAARIDPARVLRES
jgi:putative ABC transport system permease protein